MSTIQPTRAKSPALTKYPLASFRELAFICLPLVVSLIFLSLTNICDRFFLSRYSLQALEACTGAAYLASLFQVPCMRITSIAQVLVGRYLGAHKLAYVGAAVWQMIWVSLLSTFLTLPLGLFIAQYFFDPTSIKALGSTYFNSLILGNFLFPLGAALAAFFIGQGRIKVVTWTMLLSLVVHMGLDKLLIFGTTFFVPPLGIQGAALSTLTAQFLYCLILFILFLRQKERSSYGTSHWQLRKDLLKEGLQLGLPRAAAKLIVLSAWAAVVGILARRGENYLLVLSITGSFHLFFACFTEAFGQGLITTASFMIGAQEWERFFHALKSAFKGLFCIISILSLFLVVFPENLIGTFYPQSLTSHQMTILTHACWGLWLYFLLEGVAWIGLSLLIALGQTKFLMFYQIGAAWVFNYCPIYIAFSLLGGPPEMLWVLMAFPCLAAAVTYTLRLRKQLKFVGG